mmetsp:Transcript_48135/g.118096  ORF Transcript_48135/g.118096 Transcript_48135/m.118096 type:complete len:97 (+) Transcript_48135:719-1009(+)
MVSLLLSTLATFRALVCAPTRMWDPEIPSLDVDPVRSSRDPSATGIRGHATPPLVVIAAARSSQSPQASMTARRRQRAPNAEVVLVSWVAKFNSAA